MLDASADKSVACVSVSREVFGKETGPKHNRLIGLPYKAVSRPNKYRDNLPQAD